MIRRQFMKTAFGAALGSGVAAGAAGATPTVGASSPNSKPAQPRVMFYHDSRHPLMYMYEPPMQKEEVESTVYELIGTPVEAIMFGLGDGRTMFHDTRAGEVWGRSVEKWPHLIFRRAHQNVEGLLETGHDPLRLVVDRAHQKGMLLYPTLLVNQGRRGKREDDVRSSNFRWENLHLEIGAAGDLPEDFPGNTCLDFKHREVRDERFALIQEVLNNYPVDGFELQLNYKSPAAHFFHPRQIQAGKEIMTAWIGRVYEAVKKDSARELVIRIPADLETCLALGLDVPQWVEQGIVDVLVGETFAHRIDASADFRGLVELVRGSGCRVHGSLNCYLGSDRLSDATVEVLRAASCNYWEQGIDGLYLAQWFGQWPYHAPFYEQLREVPFPDLMASKDKIYVVPTGVGYNPPAGEPEMPLPVDLEVGKTVKIELPVSDDLPGWERAGRVQEVLLRLRLTQTTELDRVEFRLNNRILPGSSLRKINHMFSMKRPRFRGRGYWYIYRLERQQWPVRGRNTVEVTLLERDPDVTPILELHDVELEVRYLMAKNFSRGEDDPALGSTVYDRPI